MERLLIRAEEYCKTMLNKREKLLTPELEECIRKFLFRERYGYRVNYGTLTDIYLCLSELKIPNGPASTKDFVFWYDDYQAFQLVNYFCLEDSVGKKVYDTICMFKSRKTSKTTDLVMLAYIKAKIEGKHVLFGSSYNHYIGEMCIHQLNKMYSGNEHVKGIGDNCVVIGDTIFATSRKYLQNIDERDIIVCSDEAQYGCPLGKVDILTMTSTSDTQDYLGYIFEEFENRSNVLKMYHYNWNVNELLEQVSIQRANPFIRCNLGELQFRNELREKGMYGGHLWEQYIYNVLNYFNKQAYVRED